MQHSATARFRRADAFKETSIEVRRYPRPAPKVVLEFQIQRAPDRTLACYGIATRGAGIDVALKCSPAAGVQSPGDIIDNLFRAPPVLRRASQRPVHIFPLVDGNSAAA